MFIHKSDFALACLFFATALLAMICCIVTAPSTLKPIAMLGTIVFITASFMRARAQPFFSRERWRRASRVVSLLMPVPYFFCLLSHSLVPEQILKPDHAGPLAQIINLCAEETYLHEAESLERAGKYYEAEGYYRRWIDVRQRLHPRECLDGVLARILDLQGCHSEAEQYYSSLEKHCAESMRQKRFEEASTGQGDGVVQWAPVSPAERASPGSLAGGRLVLADGRLLRILQTISRQEALREFDFAGSVLKCADLPASQLGQRLRVLDLDLVVKDFRSAEDEKPPGARAPVPNFHDAIAPIESAGRVLEAQEVRRHLSKIGRSKALAEFEFADYFFATPGARFVRENYEGCPLSGYKNIACVRDLIPKQIAVISDLEYKKLRKLSGL